MNNEDTMIEYINENKTIPFDIYLKYKEVMDLRNKFIECKCEKCGCMFSNRGELINKKDRLLCQTCVKKVNIAKNNNIPEYILFNGNKNNPIEYNDYIKYKEFISGKKWVRIKCKTCNEYGILQIRKFTNRKYLPGEQICNNCIMKEVTNIEEWKHINSEAQKIAQNIPERKARMSKILKDKFKNDDEFAKKITTWSDRLCGEYDGIRFLSSWELSVIILFYGNIKNSSIKIPYIDGKGDKRFYLPDFDLIIDNKKILIEVKGKYKENDYIKIKTTRELIKNKQIDYDYYWVIDGSNIKNIKDIIIFDNYEKLKLINQNKLMIRGYPKSWNIKI